jgi:hypothetical protein
VQYLCITTSVRDMKFEEFRKYRGEGEFSPLDQFLFNVLGWCISSFGFCLKAATHAPVDLSGSPEQVDLKTLLRPHAQVHLSDITSVCVFATVGHGVYR